MVKNDRTKKGGHIQRAMATSILAARRDGVASGGGDMVDSPNDHQEDAISEDEEPASHQKQPRIGKARRNSELLNHNEQLLDLMREKHRGKVEMQNQISQSLAAIVNDSKKPNSIAMCGKSKVNKSAFFILYVILKTVLQMLGVFLVVMSQDPRIMKKSTPKGFYQSCTLTL